MEPEMPWFDTIQFSKSHIVYDIIYNPKVTQLQKFAQEQGAKTINGLGMLVHQGALAFALWTGQNAPVSIMMQAARVAL